MNELRCYFCDDDSVQLSYFTVSNKVRNKLGWKKIKQRAMACRECITELTTGHFTHTAIHFAGNHHPGSPLSELAYNGTYSYPGRINMHRDSEPSEKDPFIPYMREFV